MTDTDRSGLTGYYPIDFIRPRYCDGRTDRERLKAIVVELHRLGRKYEGGGKTGAGPRPWSRQDCRACERLWQERTEVEGRLRTPPLEGQEVVCTGWLQVVDGHPTGLYNRAGARMARYGDGLGWVWEPSFTAPSAEWRVSGELRREIPA